MARLRFRITIIHLDEEEDVEGIDARVHNETHAVIEQLIGERVPVVESDRGGTELVINLGVRQLVDLFGKAGKFAPVHPEHKHTKDIYESLSFVVYGLMEKD